MQFRNAMMHPDICLRRYAALNFDGGTIQSTKYFVECRAQYYGNQIMVYAPTTPLSVAMATRAIAALDKKMESIGSLTIVANEMLCTGVSIRRCSLIVEKLPAGTPLSEALYTFTNSHLKYGLELLEAELKKNNIFVNHLHPDNIIVDGKYKWHVIRPFYVSREIGDDTEAFDKLRELIDRCSLSDTVDTSSSVCDGYAEYGCTKGDDGRIIYTASEGLCRFKSNIGVGFEDEQGNIVIADEYYSATDFMEDRSIVETFDHKMGIIDRSGKYILRPIYRNIEFNIDNGESRVVSKGRYATFDYFGNQLTDWTPITNRK
ncbi:MAG: WG repeat-containing protein [Alistipes sp.]|nr:WG repeat-containing protein [Alistipes sp.]